MGKGVKRRCVWAGLNYSSIEDSFEIHYILNQIPTDLEQLPKVLHVLGLHLRETLGNHREVRLEAGVVLRHGIERCEVGSRCGHELLGRINDWVVVRRGREDLRGRGGEDKSIKFVTNNIKTLYMRENI